MWLPIWGVMTLSTFFFKLAGKQRPEFEKVLRDAGLWEQVSSPNGKKLQSLWKKREELPEDVREALAEYFSFSEKVDLSFKKRQVEED